MHNLATNIASVYARYSANSLPTNDGFNNIEITAWHIPFIHLDLHILYSIYSSLQMLFPKYKNAADIFGKMSYFSSVN